NEIALPHQQRRPPKSGVIVAISLGGGTGEVLLGGLVQSEVESRSADQVRDVERVVSLRGVAIDEDNRRGGEVTRIVISGRGDEVGAEADRTGRGPRGVAVRRGRGHAVIHADVSDAGGGVRGGSRDGDAGGGGARA